ncbi:TPA: hypothetical protein RVS02_003000 [Aeromonas veronii]|uniref:hypothetical protein n=1 Tax=Aeromonas veronii TaxID=654 RepID=UPI001E309992|nr:hypothetical protein [Aeromonas veronii]MCD6619558.1 hypothetical protein [Aeromonas veronii]HEA3201457.1 hypothetical protein [Aeromonas veronii]
MAQYPSPWSFHPEIQEAHLIAVAEVLLDVLHDTYQQLHTKFDDNYTRGTCTFGRQRNALIDMCQSKKHPYLELTHAGMDVTFCVSGIPVRFFADDPESPKKPGFFRRNSVDQLFEPVVQRPVMHRFVVEKPQFEDEAPRIHFVGYNEMQEIVSLWSYGGSPTAPLSSVGTDRVDSVPIELDSSAIKLKKPSSSIQPAAEKKV